MFDVGCWVLDDSFGSGAQSASKCRRIFSLGQGRGRTQKLARLNRSRRSAAFVPQSGTRAITEPRPLETRSAPNIRAARIAGVVFPIPIMTRRFLEHPCSTSLEPGFKVA